MSASNPPTSGAPARQMAQDWLVCPDCRTSVDVDDRAARCRTCAREWPHRNGIPCFVEDDYYWGGITRDEIQEVLRAIDTRGFDAATALLRSTYAHEYHLAFEPSRASWLSFIDPPSYDLALDIGAGYGGIARWMSASFRNVVGLEANTERTTFASHLYRNTGATNAHPLIANVHHAPLRRGAFDLISLTGVLEWAAMFGKTTNAVDAQRELLRTCWDLLKPGGQLYIAIENRFAPGFLLGYRDHGRFPYAGVLPYAISKHLVRRFQAMERQPLTHSRGGLLALLRGAGFGDEKVCFPLPGYHRPMVIAESEDKIGPAWLLRRLAVPSAVSDIGTVAVACWRVLQRNSRMWPLIKPVVPAFMVFSRKSVS